MPYARHYDGSVAQYIPKQPDWLFGATILLVRHGSHAYGTSLPTSDLDVKGIAVPPRVYWLGFSQVFEQAQSSDPVDLCVYGLRKFMNLAADCNPNIIEVLSTDDSDVLLSTPAGDLLRENKELFLSQKAKHTFSGYAISQLKRIKTHRRWLLSPPTAEPTRAMFDLPERKMLSGDQRGAAMARIQQYVDSWELDLSSLDEAARIHVLEQLARVIGEQTETEKFVTAGRLLGFNDNMLDYLEREKRYQTARKEWTQYLDWKVKRNAVRAELEVKFGYDTKHAMHLVRLLRMCREILEGKGVIVKRPDAEELLSIRQGAWSYEKLIEFADGEDEALYAVMKASGLPKAAPRDQLDKLCEHIAQMTFATL